MKKPILSRWLSTGVVLILMLLGAGSTVSFASTFLVTNTNDSGPGSLRQAILDSNFNDQDDSIDFDATLFSTPQTIELTSGMLEIKWDGETSNFSRSLTINGPGASLLTISGNHQSRVISVEWLARAVIDGVRIINGNGIGGTDYFGAGGGILVKGGSIAGGVDLLILKNSIITGNASIQSQGGGVYVYGNASIINCAIYNNTAATWGGGVGAYLSVSSRLRIINSTVSQNSAVSYGGGIVNSTGPLWLINSTIAFNTGTSGTTGGGGIAQLNSAVLHTRNSIIANNTLGTSTFISDISGPVVSEGYNIIGSASGITQITGVLTGNQLDIDPQLDPVLGPNGGYLFTHALLAGSPAIDRGDNCVLSTPATGGCLDPSISTDERGMLRPQDGDGDGIATVDIGAFEADASATQVSTPSTPDLLPTSDSGTSNTDNITANSDLSFNIGGVEPGGNVELFRDGSPVASGPATTSSVVLTDLNITSNGPHEYTARQTVSGNISRQSEPIVVIFDNIRPTTTVNQSSSQTDPTYTQPINFDITVSESVVGFDSSDVSLAGSTAGVSNANLILTGNSTAYGLSVGNISSYGTVTANIQAGAFQDIAGNSNWASISNDNSVSFQSVPQVPVGGFRLQTISSPVTTVSIEADQKILIGGGFTSVNGQNRAGTARLLEDGSNDSLFQNPFFAGGEIRLITTQSDGKILVGGNFRTVNGQDHKNLVRLNSDGSLDSTFNPIVNKDVTSMSEQADHKLIIGGLFTTVDGQTHTSVARINTDGTLDSTFQDPALTDDTPGSETEVSSIVVQPDGNILIGGFFDKVSGSVRSLVARLNPDGSLDTSFQDPVISGGNGSSSIRRLMLQSDGKVLLTGNFAYVGGFARSCIGRLNADGSTDTTFQNPNISDNGLPILIRDSILQPNGSILIAGSFSSVGGQRRRKLARVYADGTLDPTFIDPNVMDGGFITIALQQDGKVIVAGDFTMVGGRPRSRLTRLMPDGSLDVPEPMTFIVTKVEDTNDGVCNSDCSLREAIAAANSSESTDTIVFDPTAFSGPRTISLSNGQLAVCNTGDLTINGPGADLLTLSGNHLSRIMRLFAGPVVTINQLKFSNGNAHTGDFSGCTAGNDLSVGGAAIENRADLTLNNVVISNNEVTGSGGGLANIYGTVRLNSSVVSGNTATFGFGGIVNIGIVDSGLGNLIVFNSRISDNSCLEPTGKGGGGIGNLDDGFITIDRSSVTNNTTVTYGGGIYSEKSTVSVLNSTIGANSSKDGGGIFADRGKVNISSSTIAFNTASQTGGGIGNNSFYGPAIIHVGNAILANNSSPSGPDLIGSVTSDGYNLIGNTADSQITGNTAGNILNTDPVLDPLLRNNGAISLSFALLDGSPAIDHGLSAPTVLSDQRGLRRPVDLVSVQNAPGGNASDMGAFEIQLGRAVFDFDGDGKTDLSIFRPNGATGSEWWYLKSSNGGNFATQFGSPMDKLVAADYTGDGKADIAFFRPSTGFWYILRSEDSSFYAFPFGASGDIPAPADFDGDGKADAAVFRPSSATWYIQNSGGGTTIQAFGAAGDVPVVGDYDGDGKADIAIFRPNGATGSEWWILRSTAGLIATQFGTPTDKTVPGDYTGDGKADIAIWRPSNGQWYILRSEDLSFYAFPFGSNGDIPVPGDYDGDGKADAAVFRPASATWFAQGSTSGTIIQQFGAAGDVPVPNEFVR